MNQTTFKRYLWLIDTIYKSDKEGITYENISKQWKESDLSNGKAYPLRTFHNHRNEIKSVFNVTIRCKKKTNSYYIVETDGNNVIMKKLLELIAVSQLLDNRPEMSKHLTLEVHPGGECYLGKLMDAIAEKKLLKLEYKPYWSEKTLKYQFFAPYALKEFKGSWYLLGQRSASQIEIIDLKKVISINTMVDTFVMPSDDVLASLLNDHFGTVVENIETEEIMIKVGAQIANYLRHNPLHTSQREIERKRGYSVFYFYLKPNADFRRDIHAFGTLVEVLAPQHLRSEISQEAKAIAKNNS